MGIIIMGGTGTGKSTVAQILAQRTGFSMYEVGHVVKHLYYDSLIQDKLMESIDIIQAKIFVDNMYEEHSKDFFTKQRLEFANRIKEKHGNDFFVKKILEMGQTDNIIIVGARTQNEIRTISNFLKFPFFVSLSCNNDIVLKRFINREHMFMDNSTAKSIYIKRNNIEQQWEIERSYVKSNLVIDTFNKDPEEIASYIWNNYLAFISNINNL